MKHAFLAVSLSVAAIAPSHASVLPAQTNFSAAGAPLYGAYHDQATDFVFVRRPAGWSFVAKDTDAQSHEVFLDASTGFVFVKLSTGWKFVK